MKHAAKIEDQDPKENSHIIRRWMSILFSILAAALGIQSSKNRQRDFSNSSPWPYVFGAIFFMVLFVGLLIGLVQLVL